MISYKRHLGHTYVNTTGLLLECQLDGEHLYPLGCQLDGEHLDPLGCQLDGEHLYPLGCQLFRPFSVLALLHYMSIQYF